MRVILTPQARGDLRDIGDYIGQDNPTRARSFVRELVAKALELGDLPRAFPLVSRYAKLDIRRRSHGRYLILYRVFDDRVLVLRFVQGSRNYEALLDQDN